MLIRLGYEIGISCPVDTPIVTMLGVHPDRLKDLRSDSGIETSPAIRGRGYFDQFGNRCMRFVAPAGNFSMRYDAIVDDPGTPDEYAPDAEEVAIADLPDDALVFLLGSRYCETDPSHADRMGSLRPHQARLVPRPGNLRLRAQSSVLRLRLCALHAHRGPGLRRARRRLPRFCPSGRRPLPLHEHPARYVNGYMGDIGVPADPAPMDFNAWFEVYLGGRWYTFDARHNQRRIGRVVVAAARRDRRAAGPYLRQPSSRNLPRLDGRDPAQPNAVRQNPRHTSLTMQYQNPATQSRSQTPVIQLHA